MLFTLAITSPCARAQTAHFDQVITLGGGFAAPWGLAVDASGNIYVADITHNTVTKMTAGCMSPTCMTTLGGGFSAPIGAAVDGSGNVYVTDSGNNAVKKIPAGCTTSACVITLGGGFSKPYGVAVDGSGNIYVADSNNYAVKKIPAGCASSACVTTLGGGFHGPAGIAVDGIGYVYVADAGVNLVKEIPSGCASATCVKSLGGGFSVPAGVAVDHMGSNVYVGDYGNNAVKEIPAGCTSTACVKTLGTGLSHPQGVAVDPGGNIYEAETGNHAVKEIVLNGLNFFSGPVGSTSASIPLTFTFDTGGTIQAPAVLTMGAANLDFLDAGGGSCTTNGSTYSYNTGDTCTVNVKFRPKFAGTRYGAAVLKNASGAAIATAYVYGTGVSPQAVFSPSAITTLGGGFAEVGGIAVDGIENVYVADGAAVKQVPAGCMSSGCVNLLGGGFNVPADVAVDGSGNVYVADSMNSAVKKMPAGCTSSACVTILGSGFSYPRGVAVDGAGNVYVADSSHNAVKEMPPGCASSACVTILGGGFDHPEGVTVDGRGSVYVSEFNPGNEVKEMPAGCTSSACVSTLGGGFNDPGGLALDGSGNLYVADLNNGALKQIPAGCATSACVTTLGGGFSSPFGVAVDGGGNVYVTDVALNAVEEIQRATPPTLSFALTQVGQKSSPQNVMVSNVGNAALNFAIPSAGFNPSIPVDFVWDDASTCEQTGSRAAAPFSLAPAASCTIAIDFEPPAEKIFTGSVVLTDNNGNASTVQQIPVSGQGMTPTLLTSPTPGSILGGPTTFTWNTRSGVTSFQIYAGTAGAGSRDVYWGPDLPGTATSSASVNIPIKGATLYVRLWYLAGNVWQYQDYTYSEMTPPYINSPAASTSLGGPTKFTWSPGSVATEFQLYIGSTGPGSHDIYWGPDLPGNAISSASINIPLKGATLYVRLWYQLNGSWFSQDYTYQEATPPSMTGPAPGAYIGGPTTFTWNPGLGSTGFQIYAGTSRGSHDMYLGPDLPATATSSAPVSIPVNGLSVYVRLWYQVNGNWLYQDYGYLETTPPAIFTPSTDRRFCGRSTGFGWDGGPGQSLFKLYVGTQGPGSSDLYLGSSVTNQHYVYFDIPCTGTNYYVRLWYLIYNSWLYRDYVYTAANNPYITNPAEGSVLAGPTVFTWYPSSGVSEFSLWIGTSFNNLHDVYMGPDLSGTVTSSPAINIPPNGKTLLTVLFYRIGNTWSGFNQTYTEASPPSISSPAPGSAIGGPTTFTWTPGVSATSYQVYVGTTGVGSRNIYQGPNLPGTATSSASINIPTGGGTLYVRLWYQVSSTWYYADYTYTEQ